MKFKVGDKVKFVRDGKELGENGYVPPYDTTHIPRELLIHGHTRLSRRYLTEHATIMGIYGERYAVKFFDYRGKYTCLGFEERYLKGANIDDWRAEFK